MVIIVVIDVSCPTDTRKRMDVRSLERGDVRFFYQLYESAEKYLAEIAAKQTERENQVKKTKMEYKPV